MTHEDAFLQDILQAPDDDVPRRIFADWLEDHGQPERGEFLRVQIELAHLPADDPRQDALAEREADLLAEHGQRWRAPLRDLGATRVEFRRGLIESVWFSTLPKTPLRAVFEAAPVRQLWMEGNAAVAAELASLPEATSLRTLLIHSRRKTRVGPEGARALAESPYLGKLSSLGIVQGAIEAEGVRALVESPRLRSLTELILRCDDLTDDSAALLAESPLLPRLRSLDLGWNYLQAAGAGVLLASPACAGLEVLALDDNSFTGPEVARVVAAATHLHGLSSLDLGESSLSEEGAAALASAPHLASLRKLVLQGCHLGDAGVRRLAGSPHLAGLRELWLCNNAVGTEGLAALGQAPFWPGLRHLTLNDASITDAGLEALADAPALASLSLWYATAGTAGWGALGRKELPSLERLDLSSLPALGDEGLARLLLGPGLPSLKHLSCHATRLTEAGLASLAGSPRLAQLRSLSLMDEPVGDTGARTLATSPHAAGLRELSLCGCGVGEEGARALAASPYLGRLVVLGLHRNVIDPAGAGAALRDRFGDRVSLP